MKYLPLQSVVLPFFLVVGFVVATPKRATSQAPIPAADAALVRWLEENSMLSQARDAAATVSGRPEQWRHRYGKPQSH